MDDNVWADDFVDKSMRGKTFSWTYEHKTEWVDFTLTEMQKPTGVFKQWKDYCKYRKLHSK